MNYSPATKYEKHMDITNQRLESLTKGLLSLNDKLSNPHK